MNRVALIVNAEDYRGWTEFTLTRSLERMAASFYFGIESPSGESLDAFPVVPGDFCRISVDDVEAVQGYVDETDENYESASHRLSVTGRSRSGDLVDCSAASKVWRRLPLSSIARDILEPFGLSVSVRGDAGGNLRKFSIQEGESSFEALRRLAKNRGFLLQDDGKDKVIFSRPGVETLADQLTYGVNISTGSRSLSWVDRFSEYRVKSQTSGSDDWYGSNASGPVGTARDTAITRHRPLTILADEQSTTAELQRQATFEKTSRIGRSARYNYRVEGWKHSGGQLWAPNVRIPVSDQRFDLYGSLLLVSATFRLAGSEQFTELELAPVEAFGVGP